MNRDNIQLLRDTLATHYSAAEGFKVGDVSVGFNMNEWIGDWGSDKLDNCDTVACLGGWCDILRGRPHLFDQSRRREKATARWLNLPFTEARQLFYPTRIGMSSITVPEALVVIDNLLATGTVNWSIIVDRRAHITAGGYVPVAPVYGRPEEVSA